MTGLNLAFKVLRSPSKQQNKREKERIARVVRASLRVLFLFSVLLLLVFLIIGNAPTTMALATITMITTALLMLSQKDHPQLTAYLTVLYLLLLAPYTMITGYGIYDVSSIIYPSVLLMASVVLPPRAFIGAIFLVVLSIFGVGYADYRDPHILLQSHIFEAGHVDIIVLAILTGAVGVFTWLISSNLLTALKTVEQKEENYQVIFDATHDAIFLYDYHTHKIIDSNDALRKMFGLPDETRWLFSPVKLSAKQDKKSRTSLYRHVQRTIHKGPQSFEWHARRDTGETFWIEAHLQKTILQNTSCILGVIRDIDERKNYEDERRQNEKLTAIGQLAGGIAHDFNNQLTGIIGITELLQKKEGADQCSQQLNTILQSAHRAAELTDQLLSFARKGSRTYAPIDSNRLIEEVQLLLERSIDKKVSITSHLTKELPKVNGDSTQLQNALLNLGINARDAQPKGGTIVFKTRETTLTKDRAKMLTVPTKEGDYVVISVEDKGLGIPLSIRQKIFDPFFTTKPLGEGTGMGLAAVYGTIYEHGGGLQLTTEEGVGTTITLYLPIAQNPEQPQAITRTIDIIAQKMPKGRILVVDDEPVLRLTMKLVLEQAGHTITTATSGTEALAVYQKEQDSIDLIILDMIMPDMGGLETVQRLAEINPSTPVIIASGYSSGNELEEAMKVPMVQSYLAKPFKENELQSTVASILLEDAKEV